MKQIDRSHADDVSMVLKAATFAAHKHRDHRCKDKKKRPYINHPLALAQALCEEGAVSDPIILAAAQQVKLADKLCNLRDMLASSPAKWSKRRKREYFDWAKAVVDQVRGANPRLAKRFDAVWEAGRIA